jgi:hypothetical protein
VIVVNDNVAQKTVDGRCTTISMVNATGKITAMWKYYLFNKAMYTTPISGQLKTGSRYS